MILLDTHAMIWAAHGNPKMGVKAQALVKEAAEAESLFLSPISAWELAMLVGKGRLTLARSTQSLIDEIFSRPGVRLAQVTPAIAVLAGELPIHGDPGDRFLIATARALSLPLLTADRFILDYAAKGQVQAIDARR